MIRADIKQAAERLYCEAAGEMLEPEIDVALRDGAARRDFERVVTRTLVAEPDARIDVAESVLSGTVEGSDGADWHADVLAAFLADKRRRLPAPLHAFLKLAGRPSRWGDAYAGATLGGPDGLPALFRILVQVELAPTAVAVGKDGAPRVRVEMDTSFGPDASRDPRQQQRVEDAVVAAFGYLRDVAPGRPIRDIERARVVRVFRGGLPWPLSRDSTLPTVFELQRDEEDHAGPSMGLPIALGVLHAFLPHWTTVDGPLCAATGHVTRTGSVEAVGNVEDKAEAAVRADLPFLFPRRGAARGVGERFRHTAVDTLAAAAAAAFNLAGDDVDGFLSKRPPVLFGREDQRDIPARAWERARGGQPRLVLVHGPSGIGKSGLVARSMRKLMEAGVPIVFARAAPNESLVFDPIADRLVAGLASKELRLHSQEYGPWLASSVEALEIFLPQHFKRTSGDSAGQAIEKKVRSIRGLVQACAARHGGLALVIDDVQWGKEETWPVLRQLLEPARAAPLLVLATYRRDADGVSPEAELSLAALRAAGVVEDIELAGLAPDAIRRWVSSALPSLSVPASELAAALEEVAAGNPLHIGNHLGKLADVLGGNPSLDASEVLAMVRKVGLDVMLERLRDHPSLAMLKLAATVRTTEFSMQLLQEASPADGKALHRDVAGAQAARFIAPAGPHRFTFVHESTRDLVRALINPDEAADLNLHLAKALERRASQYEGTRVPVADLAQHFAEAATVAGGDAWEKARHYAVLAAEDNTRRLAYESVLTFRLLALKAFDAVDIERPAQRAELLLEAGRAHSYLGQEDDARPCFREARWLAIEEDLPDLALDATVGFAGPPEDTGLTPRELLEYLREARKVPARPGDVRRARIESRYTFEMVLAARREPEWFSMPPVTEILDGKRSSGDKVELSWALLARLMGYAPFDEPPAEPLALAVEMAAEACDCGEYDVVAWALGFRVIHLLQLGRRAEAEVAADELATLGQELHYGYARWGAAVLRPVFAHLDGRFEESLVQAEEARDLRRSAFNSHLYYGIQRILTHREQGKLEEVERFMEELIGRMRENRIVGSLDVALNGAMALLSCELGNLARGRTMFDQVVAMGIPNTVEDPAWSAGLAFLTDVSVALDDPRLAPRIYDLLVQRTGQSIVIAFAVATLGAVDRYLGKLATLERRWETAEQHFRIALQMNGEELRSPTWLAHTQYDYALMLAGRARDGDRAEAVALCSSARETAGRLGMRPLHGRAEALLTRLASGQSAAATGGPASPAASR